MSMFSKGNESLWVRITAPLSLVILHSPLPDPFPCAYVCALRNSSQLRFRTKLRARLLGFKPGPFISFRTYPWAVQPHGASGLVCTMELRPIACTSQGVKRK